MRPLLPPTGPNSFVFTQISTEKHPHQWSAPQPENPGSATDCTDSLFYAVDTQYTKNYFQHTIGSKLHTSTRHSTHMYARINIRIIYLLFHVASIFATNPGSDMVIDTSGLSSLPDILSRFKLDFLQYVWSSILLYVYYG